ncbi:MAG: SDR family oxidoreductase [Oscillatoriales cyanobacterium RM1_1_9]|nr:SDR family oxidoreductase [Oscillatoriales cyanobacterium RM1_1_9]
MQNNGRVAVVTGAGSGIGRAAALRLQEAGYRVVIAGRRAEELERRRRRGRGLWPIPSPPANIKRRSTRPDRS